MLSEKDLSPQESDMRRKIEAMMSGGLAVGKSHEEISYRLIGVFRDETIAAIRASRKVNNLEEPTVKQAKEVGDIIGHYEILERLDVSGKNSKFRVKCTKCNAVMFRYANKFKADHWDCFYFGEKGKDNE